MPVLWLLWVGWAGCQKVSCLQSGGTDLTTPTGHTDLPYLVCVEWPAAPLSYVHTLYPVALCAHPVRSVGQSSLLAT